MNEFTRSNYKVSSFDDSDSIDETVEKIISIISQMMKYWKNAHGWAPNEAAELLNRSMLDLQSSLSESLRHWTGPMTLGDLTLAWTNLGAIVEGQLKLFLCVYYLDYLRDDNAIKKKRKESSQINIEIITPDRAKFDDIRLFFRDNIWMSGEKWDAWILNVQQKRNNIHAFKFRDDLGSYEDYFDSLYILLQFIRMINDRLPYHDDEFKPYPFILHR